MEITSPEVKPLDLLRCDRDGCNRWWKKADLKTLGSDGFQKCPHCREVKTTPTKYWIGGVSGPREQAYDYPARTPQMHPLPLKSPADRSNSVKRPVPGDSPTATPTQNKRPRNSQHQQQVGVEGGLFNLLSWLLISDQTTPIKTSSVAETARMERKDSLQSITASPAESKATPSREAVRLKSDFFFAAWESCKGCPDSHLQKELKEAEANLEKLQSSIPRIERKVQESRRQHEAAEADLKRKEVFQEELDKSIAKAGLDEGDHKPIKDGWYIRSRQHAQLAFEKNSRLSKAWQDAVKDKADALKLEKNMKQKIEDIKEERKHLKSFAEIMSLPPSSTGA